MHHIRSFLAVSETLNFTRAAEQCNVAPPSLTRAVRKREQELGGPLFPGIKTRAVVEPEVFREISLVTVRGRRFFHAVEAFVRFARAHNRHAPASACELSPLQWIR